MDASKEPDGGLVLGRLVNHGRKSERNAHIRVLSIDGSATLCMFALCNIPVNEEILYDYGLPEKDLPWNKQVSCVFP